MEKVIIKAIKREVTGKQVKALRRAGKLPAVMFGYQVESTPITLDTHEVTKLLGRLSSSSIVTIDLDGKQYPTLVREKQRDYIKNRLLHVDFQVVSLTEKIRSQVRIELTGTAPAVTDYSAIIVNSMTELEVEGLPADLPERIIVDISNLVKIGDGVHVHDVVVSDKVIIIDDPDEIIVHATAPRVEEVEEVVPEEVEVVEPEVIERGKKEEEEMEER
ncbi:MAG: 50S ribosomal protein L25, partial [Anaerolineales bacterium]|nr:50S ribosomal protein L25 [Anaerolineales bacterium]